MIGLVFVLRYHPFVDGFKMTRVSRLEHTSLLSLQIILFELLHRLSPFLNKHIIHLPQIPLSSPEPVFVSLISSTEFIKIE